MMAWVKAEPILDKLRKEERYQAILQKKLEQMLVRRWSKNSKTSADDVLTRTLGMFLTSIIGHLVFGGGAEN